MSEPAIALLVGFVVGAVTGILAYAAGRSRGP